MGDTTNVSLLVPDVPDERLRPLITSVWDGNAGTWNNYETDNDEGGRIYFGANDVSVGAVERIASQLEELWENEQEAPCTRCEGKGEYTRHEQQALIGGPPTVTCEVCDGAGVVEIRLPEFAFEVHSDPKYEWLGELIQSAPGLGRFSSDCDADGNVVVDADSLMRLIDQATDLDALKAEVAKTTGRAHHAALYGHPDAQEATA